MRLCNHRESALLLKSLYLAIYLEGTTGQTPPKRPVPPSSSVQRSVTSTSTAVSSSSSTHVSAAAIRNQTSKVTTKTALQAASSSINDGNGEN